jgi:hypothetical protein
LGVPSAPRSALFVSSSDAGSDKVKPFGYNAGDIVDGTLLDAPVVIISTALAVS